MTLFHFTWKFSIMFLSHSYPSLSLSLSHTHTHSFSISHLSYSSNRRMASILWTDAYWSNQSNYLTILPSIYRSIHLCIYLSIQLCRLNMYWLRKHSFSHVQKIWKLKWKENYYQVRNLSSMTFTYITYDAISL